MKAALNLGGSGCPEKQRMIYVLNEGRKIDPWEKFKGNRGDVLYHLATFLKVWRL